MGSISVPTAILASSAVAGAGSLASGIMGSSAAKSAAQTAANAQLQASQTIQNALSPFRAAGMSALPTLEAGLTNLDLTKLPGYNFQLQQGLQATQNAAAARGLGVSGAALKGAAGYATGLAQSNFQNAWNDMFNLASLGENAAAQTGIYSGQAQAAAGQAQAAGTVGSANALTQGLTGVGGAATGGVQNYLTNQLLQRYLPGGPTGGYPTIGGQAGVSSPMALNLSNNPYVANPAFPQGT